MLDVGCWVALDNGDSCMHHQCRSYYHLCCSHCNCSLLLYTYFPLALALDECGEKQYNFAMLAKNQSVCCCTKELEVIESVFGVSTFCNAFT